MCGICKNERMRPGIMTLCGHSYCRDWYTGVHVAGGWVRPALTSNGATLPWPLLRDGTHSLTLRYVYGPR